MFHFFHNLLTYQEINVKLNLLIKIISFSFLLYACASDLWCHRKRVHAKLYIRILHLIE